jgi:hypothetical protein
MREGIPYLQRRVGMLPPSERACTKTDLRRARLGVIKSG